MSDDASVVMTEFGYLNRRIKRGGGDSRVFHTEKVRASWYKKTLDRAASNGIAARTFLIYKTAEDLPEDPDNLTNGVDNFPPNASDSPFDTGTMGPLDVSDSSRPVKGTRTYGKGGPQPRLAYCRIRDWAGNNGLKPKPNACGPIRSAGG